MSIDFQCKAFGKCILFGEHAVIRGYPGLVVPILSRSLELSYSKGSQELELRLIGDHGKELQLLVWGVLDRACAMKGIARSELKGTLLLESSLPVGAGMGASGALCVALTRWLGYLGFVEEAEYYDFARDLENLFHGESSGLDIAVALSGQALYFTRSGERRPLSMNWKPQWYISYTGKRGVTLDAVNKVKAMHVADPALGKKIDEKMNEAVKKAEHALNLNEVEGLPLIAEAMHTAAQCFEQWDLNEGEPHTHMSMLTKSGALAVKPTGSGGGGYVLSLWKEEPPAQLKAQLIPC